MRSLCFFYKILWLIGPCQPATKHYKHYKLLPGLNYSSPSRNIVSQQIDGNLILPWICILLAKDLTLGDQNWRTKSIVELSNSQLGTWIPSEFILCLDFKLNSANNEKYLHISERFTVTIFFVTDYLLIYFWICRLLTCLPANALDFEKMREKRGFAIT